MAELKSCPFCGGKAEITFQSFGVNAIITCKKCHTKFVFPWGETITALALAEKWNERAGSVVSAHWEYAGESDGKKIYRCTNCQALLSGTGNFCKECGAEMDEEVE